MADKVRFYIVDTPFGYIVSTKRIVLKLKDNNEESQYKLFDKMDDINSEIIHKFYYAGEVGEYDSDLFIISAMKCNCTCINWNEFLPQLVVFKKKNDAKKFKKVLEVRQILSTFTF